MSLVSKLELQRHLKLSPYRMEKLIAEGMPYISKADRSRGIQWTFDTEEVEEWLEQYEEEHGTENVPGSKEYEAARTRKMAAQADLAEHQLQLKRKEVVPVDAVTEIVTRQDASLRSHLLAIPSKLAPLIGADNEQLVKEAIKEALQEIQGESLLDAIQPGD